ncbi:hypothetical protein OF83DRAFT_1106996 [Amylostereum chailletii]|nr:hypothetical protein OF83DRAFT_1106996 [Amylostereum chailletii]
MTSSYLNSIPLEQRSRIIRSARKLGKVLGTTPFLLDSNGVYTPVEALPPSDSYAHLRHHTRSMTSTRFSAPNSPTKARHRHISIFDLPRLSLDNLSLDNVSLDSISLDNFPRDSLDSMDSASSTPSTSTSRSTASSMFPSPSNSAISTPHTSVDTLPLTPSLSTTKTPSKRKRSVEVPPPLVIALKTCNVPESDPRAPHEETSGVLSINTSALNYDAPSTPSTPRTPTDSERVEHRRKKLSKVMRTFGENVPLDLVFGAADSRTAPSTPQQTPKTPRFPRTESVSSRVPLAKKKSQRRRSMSLSEALAAKEITIRMYPGPDTMPFQAPPPVFTSGEHVPQGERWIGSWNRDDIDTVQRELRAMRWR